MDDRSVKVFDIVIFGASGFVGNYVIEEMATSLEVDKIKWAIAGRNTRKLQDALVRVEDHLRNEIDLKTIPIIEADVQNPSSIFEMCRRTKLLLNCVGPYNFYGGEQVVSTCIECRTHCIDLSAELKNLDTVQAKYFELAREKGVYIVQACGVGSLPTDYGITLLKNKFSGGLNSVEYYAQFDDGPKGRTIGHGTFKSILHSFADYLNVSFEKEVEAKVFKKKLPKPNYPLKFGWMPVIYSRKEKAWCLKILGPDQRNIKRSQMFRINFLDDGITIDTQSYLKVPSILVLMQYIFAFTIFAITSFWRTGRDLLEKNPSFFSAGLFSKAGPSREQVSQSITKGTFYGVGWKDRSINSTNKQLTKPDKKIKLTIIGPEPAYALTSLCMVQAGLTVLKEGDKMPLEYVVF
ncbi:saccharopine dehydrogenase-like oxidoreductase [Nephila pilipes]|uniref:Saccharopine dehydrogenase-like oxidoreductase n=1 Tax=Nephila pilipes TaxID=299642 RepID=A0A8X6TZT2_NEPPI|nr:saccharopine dehydrogenase-like oxidoreductase [Nephila pilipes]